MLPLTRSRNRARFFGIPFSPSALFEGGTVAGAWYDPSDLSTMFDSSAGTTPVAMPGQGAAVPVGLMLDKSQGLVLGPELVTNGDFDTDSDWTKGTGWTIGGGEATHAAGTASNLSQTISLTLGKSYLATCYVVSVSGGTGSLQFRNGGTTTAVTIGVASVGTTVSILYTAEGNNQIAVVAGAGTTLTVDNVTVRELPGNHAISFNNTTARPELRARVNLLEYSEQFDNAYWSKNVGVLSVTADATVAPNGTTTADQITEAAVTDGHFVFRNITTSGANTLSVYAKPNGRTWVRVLTNLANTACWFDIQNGVLGTVGAAATASIENAGNGWYRLFVTFTGNAGTIYFSMETANNGTSYTGDGTSGIYIWGADLRPANIGANVPAYQRIADANTYDTSGFPLYLRFDGIDDSMYTPANLNLSGTDKVAVFAGVRKLSDAAVGVVFEWGTGGLITQGVSVMAPQANATANYRFGSGGISGFQQAVSPNNYPAPITNVLAGIGNISGDQAILRLNGTQVASNTGDQTSGDYGNYPLYIGSRNNSSLWLNGQLYSLIIAGSAVSAGNISATEQWVAGKTGIQI